MTGRQGAREREDLRKDDCKISSKTMGRLVVNDGKIRGKMKRR
jgi:hypothetical protein